jgi:hypothetical protein
LNNPATNVQPFPAAQPRLVDEHKAAAILCTSVKTLQRWRWAGREVPFVKIGRSVRYDLADLEGYIDAHRHGLEREQGGRRAA